VPGGDDTSLFRVYYDEREVGLDGYPYAWHKIPDGIGIKYLVRELAGHRCVRCGHPYPPLIAKEHPRGEWTPCGDYCSHGGPMRIAREDGTWISYNIPETIGGNGLPPVPETVVEAQWRILTVHHLNGIKTDCRPFNLVALCQRCHLNIQGRVDLNRVYLMEHSEWFKPYAAAWYAWSYLGEELTLREAEERMEELLDLERA